MSAPSRLLLPFIERTFRSNDGGQGEHLNANSRKELAATAAAAAAATEAAKLSMALADERSVGLAELQIRLEEQAKTLAAKDAEVQALSTKNAALARALEGKPPGKAQSAGQELVQSGVQVTPLSIHARARAHSRVGGKFYFFAIVENRRTLTKHFCCLFWFAMLFR